MENINENGQRIWMREKTNQAIDIVSLATELARQKESKHDYVLKSGDMRLRDFYRGGEEGDDKIFTDKPFISVDGIGTFDISPNAHRQLAEKTKIPQPYYNRMLQRGMTGLLIDNVNAFLPDKEEYMLRTLDGYARALVSPRYKVIDNHDVMWVAMGKLKEHGATNIDAYLDETSMYLRATSKNDYDVNGKGDILQRGVYIRNDEGGNGALSLSGFVTRLVCSNGLIREQMLREVHLGRKHGVGEIISKRTIDLEADALFSGIGDVIDTIMDEANFRVWFEQIQQASQTEVTKPVEAFDHIVKTYAIADTMKAELLNAFTTDRLAGNTVWGLMNAVTLVGGRQPTIKARTDMEVIANNLMEDKKLMEVIA